MFRGPETTGPWAQLLRASIFASVSGHGAGGAFESELPTGRPLPCGSWLACCRSLPGPPRTPVPPPHAAPPARIPRHMPDRDTCPSAAPGPLQSVPLCSPVRTHKCCAACPCVWQLTRCNPPHAPADRRLTRPPPTSAEPAERSPQHSSSRRNPHGAFATRSRAAATDGSAGNHKGSPQPASGHPDPRGRRKPPSRHTLYRVAAPHVQSPQPACGLRNPHADAAIHMRESA